MNGNHGTHFMVYSGQKEGKKFMCYLNILFLMDLCIVWMYVLILHARGKAKTFAKI